MKQHEGEIEQCQCPFCAAVRHLKAANEMLTKQMLSIVASADLIADILVERGLIDRADLEARNEKATKELRDEAMRMAFALLSSAGGGTPQ